MQKSTWLWLAGGVALVGILVFIKWEIARTRREVTEEVRRVIQEEPGKLFQQVSQRLDHVLATNLPVPASASPSTKNPTQDLFGAALNVALQAGQRAGQILSSNASVAGTGRDRSSTQDTVGALMDLAAKSGQQLDQIGLGMTQLSDAEESELGDRLHKDLLREMPEAHDPGTLARLQKLAGPLLEQRQRNGIEYRLHIVRSSQINAFSSAGGHIYFTSAFLTRFNSDGELAMTLGHEIAHVELKHAVHKVQYAYHGEKVVGDLALVGQAAYNILSTPYTKEQEFEADAAGFDACRKAGWSSSSLLILFERVAELERENAKRSGKSSEATSDLGRRAGDYFRSHPQTEERLARLRKRASE